MTTPSTPAVTEPPKYFDIRSDFWKTIWKSAESYDDYLANSDKARADRWHELAPKIPPLTDDQAARLRGFNRKMHVLVYTGVWCGDCVRQGPMLKQLVDAAGPGVELRCIDRDASEQLKNELRILGAMRVPIVVFLSEDFHEVGRFGDRLLTVYLRKLKDEMGAACPVPYAAPPHGELAAERNEWLDIFERMLTMLRLSPPLRKRHGD